MWYTVGCYTLNRVYLSTYTERCLLRRVPSFDLSTTARRSISVDPVRPTINTCLWNGCWCDYSASRWLDTWGFTRGTMWFRCWRGRWQCCCWNLITVKVRTRAKIRNQYNQVPHLTQDTNGKVTASQ